MNAGRELDALVAKKVMDWKWLNMPGLRQPIMCPPEQWGAYIPDRVKIMELETCDYDPPDRVPSYSTDIAAAWQVVEKLGNWHGFIFFIIMKAENDRAQVSEPYEAGWYEINNDGYESRASASANTVPLAICLAALKAVGYEDKL